MVRICLIVEYFGRDFSGWQRQTNGLSIQAVVEDALQVLLKEPVRIYSSGRTDAGVHARGMCIHFDSPLDLPLLAWTRGLNSLLPDTVAVKQASVVNSDFNARFSAVGKWYCYTVNLGEIRSPLDDSIAWRVAPPVDLTRMREAAGAFVGELDFSAFRAAGCAAGTTVRRLDKVQIVENNGTLLFHVMGSGFLRHMVRIMVGTLMDIGCLKLDIEAIEKALQTGQRADAGRTAPAKGLCLMEVYYDSEHYWQDVKSMPVADCSWLSE